MNKQTGEKKMLVLVVESHQTKIEEIIELENHQDYSTQWVEI